MCRQQGSDTTRGIKQLTIGPTTRGIYSSLGSMELGNLASSSCFAGLTIFLHDSWSMVHLRSLASEPKIEFVVYEDHFLYSELCVPWKGTFFWCHARSVQRLHNYLPFEQLHETFHLLTNTWTNSFVKHYQALQNKIEHSQWQNIQIHSNSLALHRSHNKEPANLVASQPNDQCNLRPFQVHATKKSSFKLEQKFKTIQKNSANIAWSLISQKSNSHVCAMTSS